MPFQPHSMDDEMAPVLGAMPDFGLTASALPTIRELSGGSPIDVSHLVTTTQHVVPGDPPVAVHIHRPVRANEGNLPGVIAIHGGGYVLGSSSMDDPMLARWCDQVGMVAVCVEYRLAPETPYPGPLDDCYRSFAWVCDHAAELGIDPGRLGISGVSAGGGLAAALALLARDRAEHPVAFQCLTFPMLDDRQITASSQADGLAVWSRQSNEFGWRSYLGTRYGDPELPPTAAPARAEDLSNLPPAFVAVGGLDGFLDEDVDYALRLLHAGVPVELHVYPGAPHGFHILDTTLSRRCERDTIEWLRARVRTSV